jgi:hypothetical protein
MQRPGSRPYRAVVYLPGHDDEGRGVAVAKVSAASQEGLDKALTRWRAEGYAVAAYEEVPLPLDGENDGKQAPRPQGPERTDQEPPR